jgi:hypothetical protein
MSPAGRAIGIASLVIAVALGVYAVAAALDRWPELVVAAWGAALGAGMAINGIALRELDFASDTPPSGTPDPIGAVQYQLCTALIAVGAWQTARGEQFGWAAATVIVGVAWSWALSRLANSLETRTLQQGLRAYARSFQLLAVLLGGVLMYASVALETLWLWRPAVPADLQGFVWLVILEFAGLPLTLLAVADNRRA